MREHTHTRTQPTSTVDTHMNEGAHTHSDTAYKHSGHT